MLGIPTTAELTQAGVALEDHLAIQVDAVLHGVLDRLNGTKLVMTEGGVVLQIPPKKA